ncbi:MAG: hypothetical protein FI707_14970 [SAR202 cluster bacterium]|jgi:hypothetical protein|nr:hypothetical protein [Chloroflexota bacterium]MDP6421270.1 hypothetical protein [SAR202 cluster bacterium]MDP6664835.1 hypothetical protein [SAR202 cluster bacterium]MDP6801368.1 hypothetical protein [SAR202 cluster bacterium]MQG59517.1 hypothetical protein [SAR202 cluster bacterium]|tara:strand:+ start:2053 stop:2640 length:588 start_codon:yes stop_codon:yes gene_type:complete
MTSQTDPNEVRMTGENSFIRLAETSDGPLTTRASHWRVLWSPAGAGHVLFLKSDVTDDAVSIFADNIALARWLQDEIESMLFPEFSDQDIPVSDAVFTKAGDGRAFWTEIVQSEEESVNLTWYDFAEPFVLRVAPGDIPGRPLGVYSCFLPARRAQLTLNGLVAGGRPFPDMRGDKETTTCCIAWSETWVRPHAG